MGLFSGFGESMGEVKDFVLDPANLFNKRGKQQVAEETLQRQKETLEEQKANIAAAKGEIDALRGLGASAITGGQAAASGYLTSGADALLEGRQLGENYLGQGAGALAGGVNSALGALYNKRADQATNALQAYDVLGQQPNRLGSMLDRGLYGGFEQDPGYAFRQSEGERAINRSAAARGGRLGGSTLKDLARFNSGLASQEFANFAARRQQEAGLANQADQLGLSALLNQANRQDAASLQAQQNALGLVGREADMYSQQARDLAQLYGRGADLASGTASNLADLWSRGAGLAAGSGESLANFYGNLGGIYSNLATGQNNALTNFAQNAVSATQAGIDADAERNNAAAKIIGSIFA